MVTERVRIRGSSLSVGVVVPTSCLVGDSRIRRRAPSHVTQSARSTHCKKTIRVVDGYRVARLEDTRSTDSPPAGQVPNNSPPAIHTFQRIVSAQGEAVRHIKDGWPVVLLRIQSRRIGIVEGVIFRTGPGIRNIHVAAREVSPDVEDQRLVISIAVVVRISNWPKALIQPGRTGDHRGRTGVHLVDQITRKAVDIHSVGDIPNGISVTDDAVGVGTVIADAGRKIVAQLSLQGGRPYI